MFEQWKDTPRLLLEAPLRPVLGDRFQPTGFADLGAATYMRPAAGGKSSVPMLLVESAQSVANRLEKTCIAGEGPDIDPELEGLPYVRARLSGVGEDVVTSSLMEAHRLASPYFLGNASFLDTITREMNYDKRRPLDWQRIYATLLRYDPNSLLHGVFLSLLDGGRVRCPRAVTGFIEAENVEEVHSGGVKNSPVDPKGNLQVEGATFDKGVYSNVPYQRVEFTAATITAYFNIDLALIRGYRLGEAAERLLIGMALYKIRRFFDAHLRLRTACDFELARKVSAKNQSDFELASSADLLQTVKAAIVECRAAGLFAEPPVTELVTKVKLVEKKDADKAKAAGAGDADS